MAWLASWVNLRLPQEQLDRLKGLIRAGWTPEQVLAQLYGENTLIRKVIIDNVDFIRFLNQNKKWFLQNPERFLNYLLQCAEAGHPQV